MEIKDRRKKKLAIQISIISYKRYKAILVQS